MTIGQRIKARRLELGLTVDKLAEALGKNRATIYRYENNFIESMPITILEPLASALNTTPAFLMGWTESSTEGDKKKQDAAINSNNERALKKSITLSKKEELIISAYRSDKEIRNIIDNVLSLRNGVDEFSCTSVYRAAESADGHADEIVEMSQERLNKLKTAPETDDKLI